MKIIAQIVVFLLLAAPVSSQTTIYVNPGIGQSSSAAGSLADPFGSISAAVEEVFLGGGGEVLILGGTYDLTSPVRISTTAGTNSKVVIKPVPGEYVKFNFEIRSAFIFQESASYITLQGVEIDGKTYNSDFWSVVAQDLWSNDGNPDGGGLAIIVDGQHIKIRNNYIHDCYQKAVEIRNGRYVLVKGNVIEAIANTSLSGGHGIMRQQTGDEFTDNDLAEFYRWDIRENMIFNVEQRIYSWVPSKGFMKMVIDEGKSILIDDPKDTDGVQEHMRARIKNNIVAFGAVDHIRLKSTPNLEVSNNSVYTERPNGDGITDKEGDTDTPQFTNFICTNNAVQTLSSKDGIDINKAVQQSTDAGASPVVSGNYVMDGRVKPPGQPGITRNTNGQLFENPNGGNFRINSSLNLSGVGVEPSVITALENRASSFGTSIAWNGWVTDHLKLTQTILDNIPGINDGIAGNETVFTDAGTITSNHRYLNFAVVNGAWKAARNSPGNQEFELNPVYQGWYSSIANAYPSASGSEYERIRWGNSVVMQDQVFDPDWLTVAQITHASSTIINGFNNNFTLDGDLLIDFDGVIPVAGDSWDLISAGTINPATPEGDLFTRVLFKGFTPENYQLNLVEVNNRTVLRLTILATLPVTLSSFTATLLNDKEVRLDWTTHSELNNDYFSVERSSDGSTWQEIGQVEAREPQAAVNNYTFTDDAPAGGKNYYRLRQFDLNGSFSLSGIQAVDLIGENKLLAYPNPANGWFEVAVDIPENDFGLFNALGQEVTGQVIVHHSDDRIRVSVIDLPAGWYYFRLGLRVAKIQVL